MEKVTQDFLREKFYKAASRLNGTKRVGYYKPEVENFCEKVEILWELADDTQKYFLAENFGAAIVTLASSAQDNTPALAEQVESLLVMGKTAALIGGYLPVSAAKAARARYHQLEEFSKFPENIHVASEIRMSARVLATFSDTLLDICQTPRPVNKNPAPQPGAA